VEVTGVPWLSVLWALPMIGAVAIILLPAAMRDAAKYAGLAVSLGVLAVAVVLAVRFDPAGPRYQFVESHPWIRSFGTGYILGVDGIALALVVLTAVLMPLLLIAGFCLVLLALPAMAVFVSIELLLGRKTFQPAFSTWFAAMLFAVVPIRNVLPGNPPAGSWVDEAIVVWVLIALTAAMVTYVVAWVRNAD
jgi:hypothetical protein